MRTQDSKRFAGLLLGSLNKAEFEEEAHPRDATGKFAPKEESAPAESEHRNLRSLAREASALRAIGDEGAARKIEQKLQAARGKAEEGRRERMPKPLAPPRPQPAPAPRPPRAAPVPPPPPPSPPKPARSPLPRAGPVDVAHEQIRIDNARAKGDLFRAMRRRMDAIKDPAKMMNFADALDRNKYDQLAQEARNKLFGMGYDRDGKPVDFGAKPPAPSPEPPPSPAPQRPALAVAEPKQLRHEKEAVGELKRRASGFDDLESRVRERVLRLKNQQNNPQKVRSFADELEAQGEKYLAEEARNALWEMGYKPDGSPVPEGERFARPAHGVPRPAAPPPPSPLPEARGATGVKHPMSSVHDSGAAMKDVQFNFHDKIHKAKEMGGGIGETHRIEFKDGNKAIYKPTAGSGLQHYHDMGRDVRRTIDWQIPEGQREAVAYAISREAGFDIVPHVELVNYPVGRPGGGHAMAWVEGQEAAHAGQKLRDDANANHPDLHRIVALDFIMGNTDRHSRNFMGGKDGRWYAIDNGLAGCKDMDMSEYRSGPHSMLEGSRIPDEVKAEIRAIKPDVVKGAMQKAGFKPVDIKGALARIDYLSKARTWKSTWDDSSAAKRLYEE
jgi:hypothetical protein